MPVTPLITPAESDIYNALSSEWLVLSDDEKSAHILRSSMYMQLNWTCTDVDWSDPSTLDDDLKRACAYYADADRLALLYSPVEQVDKRGRVIMEKKKLATMEETTQWSQTGSLTSGNPLESIDAVMSLYCSSNSSKLVRV